MTQTAPAPASVITPEIVAEDLKSQKATPDHHTRRWRSDKVDSRG